MILYIRWKPGTPREGDVTPPLSPEHPLYNEPCPLCTLPLGRQGLPVQPLAIGADTTEAQAEHREGKRYAAWALLFHAVCLNGGEQ